MTMTAICLEECCKRRPNHSLSLLHIPVTNTAIQVVAEEVPFQLLVRTSTSAQTDERRISKISKNGKKIAVDIVIIYQTDQEIAIFYLQKQHHDHVTLTEH